MAPPRQIVRDSSLSYKTGFVIGMKSFLNLGGYQNRISGSTVTVILLKGLVFPFIKLHWEGSALAAFPNTLNH